MKQESEFQKSIDIAKIFEATLLGMFVLLGVYVRSIYLFFAKPLELAGMLDEESRVTATNKKYKTVRPLTFLTISIALSLVIELPVNKAIEFAGNEFRAENTLPKAEKMATPRDKMIVLFQDGLKELDIKIIILTALPQALTIGLFSYMMVQSAGKKGLKFRFTQSIGLSSYFNGCVVLSIVIVPFSLVLLFYHYSSLRLHIKHFYNLGWFWFLCSTPLLLRLFYSYLAILKAELGISLKISLLIWLGGMWRFLFSISVIVFLLVPLMTFYKII